MKTTVPRKFILFFSLFLTAIFMTGCPYSSLVPIDEGTVMVPDAIAGDWVSASGTDQEFPTYYNISIDDKYHATVKEMQYSTDDGLYMETIYHLSLSDVGGETFMNAIEEGGNAFNLYKFNFDPDADEISTSEITPYIRETFDTSKELKDYIAANKDNSYFYTDSEDVFIRKE